MGIRTHSFAPGELYHCYNRGIEKRVVFNDSEDFSYFLSGLDFYNKEGSNSKMRDFNKNSSLSVAIKRKKIIQIHAYCLNKNHFHLLIEELVDGGVSKFMQRLGTSYVMYFNKKNNRSGTLFQGKFKSVHIDTDVYLKHVGVYVNLNNLVHEIEDPDKYRSSMGEYVMDKKGICKTSLLKVDDKVGYEIYANSVLPDILSRKSLLKDLKYSEFID